MTPLNQKSVQSHNPLKSVIQTAYDIVKAHGGDIRLFSNEGEGAEFVITVLN